MLCVLLSIELCLVAVSIGHFLLGSPLDTIHRWCDLSREASVPVWFSSAQLFLVGLLFLFICARWNKFVGPSRLFFAFAGAGFLFLSMDETAIIHERTSRALINHGWLVPVKDERGAWIYLYAGIGVCFLLLFGRDLWRMWRAFRRATLLIVGGFSLTVLGGVAVEGFGMYFPADVVPLWLHKCRVALEEFLEMFGISVVLYGVLLLAIQAFGHNPALAETDSRQSRQRKITADP